MVDRELLKLKNDGEGERGGGNFSNETGYNEGESGWRGERERNTIAANLQNKRIFISGSPAAVLINSIKHLPR